MQTRNMKRKAVEDGSYSSSRERAPSPHPAKTKIAKPTKAKASPPEASASGSASSSSQERSGSYVDIWGQLAQPQELTPSDLDFSRENIPSYPAASSSSSSSAAAAAASSFSSSRSSSSSLSKKPVEPSSAVKITHQSPPLSLAEAAHPELPLIRSASNEDDSLNDFLRDLPYAQEPEEDLSPRAKRQ